VLVAHALASVGMSLPWPLLLVLVWERSGSAALLGVVASLRMLPGVLLSWAAGRLADRHARDRIIRATLLARVLALAVAAAGVALGNAGLAVAACTLAVAAATPAFPAAAAALPGLAGRRYHAATDRLVTVEAASFVVGPALGGLLLVPAARPWVPGVAVLLVAAALPVLAGVRMPAPGTSGVRLTGASPVPSGSGEGVRMALRRSPGIRGSVATLALVNLVVGTVSVALLPLADLRWGGPAAFGVAAAALGFGSLGAPLLSGWRAGCARRVRVGSVCLGVVLLLVAPAPTVWVAVAPLAVAGMLAVHVEAAATGVLQDGVPDGLRASVLGLADSVMLAAALVGSLAGPMLVEVAGGLPVLLGCAFLAAAGAVLLRRDPERSVLPSDARGRRHPGRRLLRGLADGTPLVEHPTRHPDDRQPGEAATEEAPAGAAVQQVVHLAEGPGEAPQRPDGAAGPLAQGVHRARWLGAVDGRLLEDALGVREVGPVVRAAREPPVEEDLGEQRHPVPRVADAVLPSGRAHGQPGGRGAQRALQREPVGDHPTEPRGGGRQPGGRADAVHPPLDPPVDRLRGPPGRRRVEVTGGPVPDRVEHPSAQPGRGRGLVVDTEPALRVPHDPPHEGGVAAQDRGELLVGDGGRRGHRTSCGMG
jgi:MFS family permease